MQRTALIAALLVSSAFAAEPAKHHCTPPEHPGSLASESQQKVFNRANKAYGECMKQFIEEQNQVSKVAIDAANAAIVEYNDYAKKLNALSGN